MAGNNAANKASDAQHGARLSAAARPGLAVELGLLMLPVGLACFAIHGSLKVPRITLNHVFRGAAPFAAIMPLVSLPIIVSRGWLSPCCGRRTA